jgi:hypothetical protein
MGPGFSAPTASGQHADAPEVDVVVIEDDQANPGVSVI